MVRSYVEAVPLEIFEERQCCLLNGGCFGIPNYVNCASSLFKFRVDIFSHSGSASPSAAIHHSPHQNVCDEGS